MATENSNAENSTTERKRFWNNDMEAIIGIMIVLIILGTINVFSSSFILAEAEFDTPYFFLKRHIINVVIGFIVFAICFRIDYHVWRRFMPFILLFSLVALILVLLIGPQVNGAKRWLPLGFTQFQPAEFCKLVSIMITAAYLSYQVKKGRAIEILTPQTGIILVMFALTEIEPDMGTASIIAGIPVIMLIVAGLHWKKVLYLIIAVLVSAAGLIWYQPYRLERLKVVFDPWSDAQNVGYQTVQSLSAIGSGELTGMGLGVGVSKYDYLPEAHTDFAFAIFCQENGFLGAIFVFALFAAFAVYAARIASIARDEYGQILAMGIMILIVGQAIGNLFMVGGMFPVVGIPLPFISYGGTSMIVTMAAIGILVNIGRLGKKS
ncbi:MAG: cell division protein FtsW [Selenomonadaceae bacterium]|nr:cell division protein FtsW [Selenomonadaceae bacterium]